MSAAGRSVDDPGDVRGDVAGDAGSPEIVGVVGLGLIGGSVAVDLHARGVAVVATDVDPEQRADAADAGIDVVDDVATVAARAGLVVVATPAPAVRGVLDVLDAAAPGPLVTTDVASVQSRAVLGTATGGWVHLRHVGGHPMTGTERSGFRAARRGMFDGSPWLVSADADTDVDALRRVLGLVLGLGGMAVPVDADEHDRVVAHLSHLPHVLAYAAYAEVQERFAPSVEGLAGNSFRGLTRVAATRPGFWAEVLDLNRVAVADAVAALRGRLDDVEALLRDGADAAALEAVLASGHRAVGRPRPDVPAPTSLPAGGALGDEVRAALLAHGRGGLAVAGVGADGALSWTPL